jgi:PHD/YefM family antitoxin component YafN of YafNO toxin-antitoxin module
VISLARQTMFRRDDGQAATRRKQPHAEVLVTRHREPQVNIATPEAFRETGAAVLDKIDLHGGVSALKTRQEIRKQGFNMKCTGPHRNVPAFPPFRTRARSTGFGVLQ